MLLKNQPSTGAEPVARPSGCAHPSRPLNVQSFLALAAALLTCVVLAACSRQSASQRYELKGTVVSVNTEQRLLTVAHEEIPGYMAAMTMPYLVKDEWALKVLKPGDHIVAALMVERGGSWLEQVVVSHAGSGQVAAMRGDGTKVAGPGDEVPDFSLVNQYGKPIHIAEYRGRVLLLTFIYTRCPLPDYCPLMSRNFAELDKALKQNPGAYPKTHLLSVSIDPSYDTPAVLRKYGQTYIGAQTNNPFDQWEFATGSQQEVKAIAGFFGLDYWPERNQIVHALRTVMISPQGKLMKSYSGNDWKPSDVLRDLTLSGREKAPSVR